MKDAVSFMVFGFLTGGAFALLLRVAQALIKKLPIGKHLQTNWLSIALTGVLMGCFFWAIAA
jgi:hypothetical protein